jgi:hypothetical protein
MFSGIKKIIPVGHGWLIKRMQTMGYTANDKGVCNGVGLMGMQAILADEVEPFDRRLEATAIIPIDNFKETILAYRKQSGEDITAFFDGIELYQQPQLYPDLFETQQVPERQDSVKSMHLTLSQKLEKLGGVVANIDFSQGIFSRDDLLEYFKILSSEAKHLSQPIALVLGGSGHTITVGYHPTKKKWLFINANRLPTEYIESDNIEMLVNNVLGAMSRNELALFSASIFSLKANMKEMTLFVDNLDQNWKWNELHTVTEKKAIAKTLTLDKTQLSWLEMAIDDNNFDLVKRLVAAGAMIKDIKPNLGNNILISEYLQEEKIRRLTYKVNQLHENDINSMRYQAICCFKKKFNINNENRNNIHSNYINPDKLCVEFLSIDRMLTDIVSITAPLVQEFIKDKYQYLSSEKFISDVQFSFSSSPVSKTKNELKKLAMVLQEKHVSQSPFSFFSSFHPQLTEATAINETAEKKYRLKI